jgi:broad specificity phosphatase PhoE
MKRLEVRRASIAAETGDRLSAQGERLATLVGRTCGPFCRVVSSRSPVAIETARAMGYPTPEERALWGPHHNGKIAAVKWPAPFVNYRIGISSDPPTRRLADRLLGDLAEILRSISVNGSGLVVTHAGVPELVGAALFPGADAIAWGGPLRCLEGVGLSMEDGTFGAIEILRLPLRESRL